MTKRNKVVKMLLNAARGGFRPKKAWTKNYSKDIVQKIFMPLSPFMRRAVLCWSVAAAIPLAVFGQNAFSPGGPDYAIAGALPGDQTFPHAAINATGGWLVWQDNAVDGDGLGIRSQKL